ncbi:MAG: hypothetical protein ABIH37_04440 [archaeon]
MFWTIHALFGVLLGTKLDSTGLIIFLAVLFHFIFDALPHWDGDFDREEFSKTGKAVLSMQVKIVHLIDAIITFFIIYYFVLGPSELFSRLGSWMFTSIELDSLFLMIMIFLTLYLAYYSTKILVRNPSNNIFERVLSKKIRIVHVINILFVLFLIFYFLFMSVNLVSIGIFFSLVPDIIKLFYFTPLMKFRPFRGYLKFHAKIQNDLSVAMGLVVQIILFDVLLYFIFKGN